MITQSAYVVLWNQILSYCIRVRETSRSRQYNRDGREFMETIVEEANRILWQTWRGSNISLLLRYSTTVNCLNETIYRGWKRRATSVPRIVPHRCHGEEDFYLFDKTLIKDYTRPTRCFPVTSADWSVTKLPHDRSSSCRYVMRIMHLSASHTNYEKNYYNHNVCIWFVKSI